MLACVKSIYSRGAVQHAQVFVELNHKAIHGAVRVVDEGERHDLARTSPTHKGTADLKPLALVCCEQDFLFGRLLFYVERMQTEARSRGEPLGASSQ